MRRLSDDIPPGRGIQMDVQTHKLVNRHTDGHPDLKHQINPPYKFEFINIYIAQNVQMYLNALYNNKTW